jgi:hypothetical protein
VLDNKRNGGEGGIRTLDTGVSPYNGLAILCPDVMPRNPNHLQSYSPEPKLSQSDLIRQFRDTFRDTKSVITLWPIFEALAAKLVLFKRRVKFRQFSGT